MGVSADRGGSSVFGVWVRVRQVERSHAHGDAERIAEGELISPSQLGSSRSGWNRSGKSCPERRERARSCLWRPRRSDGVKAGEREQLPHRRTRGGGARKRRRREAALVPKKRKKKRPKKRKKFSISIFSHKIAPRSDLVHCGGPWRQVAVRYFSLSSLKTEENTLLCDAKRVRLSEGEQNNYLKTED